VCLTFASSRFLIAFSIGFSASRASCAGTTSFLSMSFTSSIMSVLSSEKASCRPCTRSRTAGGVSACAWELEPSPPRGLKMAYMSSTEDSWWLRMLVHASRHCFAEASSWRGVSYTNAQRPPL
jgi:hypothetical protein